MKRDSEETEQAVEKVRDPAERKAANRSKEEEHDDEDREVAPLLRRDRTRPQIELNEDHDEDQDQPRSVAPWLSRFTRVAYRVEVAIHFCGGFAGSGGCPIAA
jgi:hypothetical protein